MTIQEIIDMVSKGQITADAANAILDKMREATAGKVPTEDKAQYQTAEQMMTALSSILDEVRNTPEGQAQIRDAVAGRKEQRFVKRYAPFFDAILAGADVMSSLSQVRQSKDALNQLKRPAMPAIPGIDPALDMALRNAQVGTMDAARAIGPARQELQDQYSKDLAVAKSIGGGQAGTLGALNQVASMRRARGAASLLPMVDSIRAREQGRADNLLQMRMNQVNQNYYNRARQAQLNMDQYNQDVTAAGQLGAVGRTNLRNAAQSLLNAAPRVAARAFGGYRDKYDAYEDMINKNLLQHVAPRTPLNFNEADIYGSQVPMNVGGSPSNFLFNPYIQ